MFKKPKKENMAALPPEELPELMMEIANASIKRTTRCLIEWQLHTMTRPAEAATTRWADIDFDTRIWTIPPERMKKRRPNTIPLTDQALSLLETLKQLSGRAYPEVAKSCACQRCSCQASAHGKAPHSRVQRLTPSGISGGPAAPIRVSEASPVQCRPAPSTGVPLGSFAK